MSYLQLRFRVERERARQLSSTLEELGALSVTWENAGDDDYFEVAYPREPDWRSLHVTGLFDSSCRPESVVHALNSRLDDALVPQVINLDDRDWERAHLSRVQPRKYRGRLWVCPSWIEPPDPGATNVIIDPGLAFGTGDHPTTTLCLDWISECDPAGKTVVDYGCGSGVLAIACLLKGAASAYGVDIDSRAVSASALNAERNGVAGAYRGLGPDELPRGLQADIVVANILSNVLIELGDALTRLTAGGGQLLLTGILEDHGERVRSAFEPSFALEARSLDGWCLLIGRKHGP